MLCQIVWVYTHLHSSQSNNIVVIYQHGTEVDNNENDNSVSRLNRLSNYHPQTHHRLAIVVPFIASQTDRILLNFQQNWNEFPPCKDPNTTDAHITLFLYFDQKLTAASINEKYDPSLIQYTLQRAFNEYKYKSCFTGGLHILDIDAPPLGHIDGSCNSFYALFERLERMRYEHFLQIEPDVKAVQSYWLDGLLRQTSDNPNCEQFWQAGSNPQCAAEYGNIAIRRDYHINGNGLYCLGNDGWREYRRRVQAFYPGGTVIEAPDAPGCATPREYELGYDHALYQYRIDPVNFEYSKTIMHKFRYSPFVVNRCQSRYDAGLIVKKEHMTFMVHSGANSQDLTIQLVNDVLVKYYNIFGPSDLHTKLQRKYTAWIRSGELRIEQLPTALCFDYYLFGSLRNYPWCVNHFLGEIEIYQKLSQAEQLAKALALPWSNRFPDQLYVWDQSLHTGPGSCFLPIFKSLNMVYHAEIDFGNAHYYGHTKDRLQIHGEDSWRGFSLDNVNPQTNTHSCPHRHRQRYYNHYRDEAEMNRVDVIFCSHDVANCELLMPLNKTLVVYVTTRLEFGRNDPLIDWRKPYYHNETADQRWHEWVFNLRTIASSSRNILAANNKYDQAYVEYFTGLKVPYIPSHCKSLNSEKLVYAPNRNQILLGPSRLNLDLGSKCKLWDCKSNKHPLWIQMKEAEAAYNEANATITSSNFLNLTYVRDLYPDIKMQQALNHRAMVLFNYQTSTMMFMELYRANVPMLAPTKRFMMDEWSAKYDFMFEAYYGHPSRVAPFSEEFNSVPDPNDFNSKESRDYWVNHYDQYVLPYITYFDSFDELMVLLNTVDFYQIHEQMKAWNKKEEARITNEWSALFKRALKGRNPGQNRLLDPSLDINENLQRIYPTQVVQRVATKECL